MKTMKFLSLGIACILLSSCAPDGGAEPEISISQESYSQSDGTEETTGIPVGARITASETTAPTETETKTEQTVSAADTGVTDEAKTSGTLPVTSETTQTAPPEPKYGQRPDWDENRKEAEQFIAHTADFSIELFKRTYDNEENSLVSPLSVLFAMSMTANGAEGETRAQMEAVLGDRTSLNNWLDVYRNRLPSHEKAKMHIANSIWFRNNGGFMVTPEFLRVNKEYYGAQVRGEPFDQSTVKKINDWADENTYGMIDSIIDEIPPEAVMYLINAVAFDAEWQRIYNESDVRERVFTDINGKKQVSDFMFSKEYQYIDDGKATGFIKPYANGYSFAALLPGEGTDVNEYISSLTGKSLMKTLNNASAEEVRTFLPKFSYEYDVSMNSALKNMGLTDAFDPLTADFLGLGKVEGENIYISKVLHKTFIEVDERGTKAGAVTSVEMAATSMPIFQPKEVILDRPFLYMIIDNDTNLPIFIGVLMTIN